MLIPKSVRSIQIKKPNRNKVFASLGLALAVLFLFSSGVMAACDGIKLNKKGNKVIIRDLYKCSDGCDSKAHLYKEHINKDASHLRGRLTKIKVASTYDSASTARKAIARALRGRTGDVKDMLDGKKNVLKFNATASVKGTCINKQCKSVLTTIRGSETIFVYLKAKGSGKSRKVYIQTSFPKVDCACP